MDCLDRFLKLGLAGEGTYGVVYKAKNKVTGKSVALKRIKLEKFSSKDKAEDYGIPSTTLREIGILKSLRHSNVIELQDVMHTDDNLYLIFEYLDLDLKRYMDLTKRSLNCELVKSYMRQLADGLAYLHHQRVLHRDMKPQNLLIDKEGHIKIGDFGLSRMHSVPVKSYTHEVVTLWYRSPELLLGSNIYSNRLDVWSLGCVMAEMLNRKALFPGDSEIDQLYKIFKALGTPNEKVWPGITSWTLYKVSFPQWKPQSLCNLVNFHNSDERELLEAMLIYDPIKRISASDISKHPYLRKSKLTEPDLTVFPLDESDK